MKKEEIQYELSSAKDMILDRAEAIKNQTLRLQKELERIVQFADSVLENVEESKHFAIAIGDDTSWRNLPTMITEIDTRIKAYQILKRVVNS